MFFLIYNTPLNILFVIRYLFLNAIANQLRYPNSHTHYFSCCLLYLFAEANSEAVQEQITRMLLERLIVNRPHPWGLLITFIELIKNPVYKFWSHEFVHCAPEIEKLVPFYVNYLTSFVFYLDYVIICTVCLTLHKAYSLIAESFFTLNSR